MGIDLSEVSSEDMRAELNRRYLADLDKEADKLEIIEATENIVSMEAQLWRNPHDGCSPSSIRLVIIYDRIVGMDYSGEVNFRALWFYRSASMLAFMKRHLDLFAGKPILQVDGENMRLPGAERDTTGPAQPYSRGFKWEMSEPGS